MVRGKEGADPAAVAFDAVTRGIEEGVDAVLIDTAGRLHTKTGLMDELGKVKRVIEKQAAVDEVLLVLDATTGQNGLVQAKVFADVVDDHRHRADQAGRHRQGRHRRPCSASWVSRSSSSVWARAPTTWRRSSRRPSSTHCWAERSLLRIARNRRDRWEPHTQINVGSAL